MIKGGWKCVCGGREGGKGGKVEEQANHRDQLAYRGVRVEGLAHTCLTFTPRVHT